MSGQAEATRLAELIRDRAATRAALDVLTFVHIDAAGAYHDEVRTYEQLWANGNRLARGLLDSGLCRGERFALMMQNHPEFVEAMIAASIIGAVFVAIDPAADGDALAYQLDLARCRGVIVADYSLPNLAGIRAGLRDLQWVRVLRSGASIAPAPQTRLAELADWYAAPASAVPLADVDASETMQLLYTSGTTGRPKAIQAPHFRFMASGAAAPMFGFQEGDRPYTGLSLTHANAQLVTLGAVLYMGLRGVISRQFTRSRLWDITRRYGCTVFNLLGGMTIGLFSMPPTRHDADNPVRLVLSAGMPAAIWDEFRSRFGVEILEFYGAAEGGLTINPPGVGPPGSVGKPPVGLEVAIFDAHGNPCPVGKPGEICFRRTGGLPPTLRYLDNEAATAEKTAGGWLHMGDVGYLDAEGWLYFLYRMGGEIRRNGEFLDRGVIEAALASCPGVLDVYVYGVRAASGVPGEKDVVAAIVPEDPQAFDPEAIHEYCRQHLATKYLPSYLQRLDALPKTASEKPLERLLLEAFQSRPNDVFDIDRVRARRPEILRS